MKMPKCLRKLLIALAKKKKKLIGLHALAISCPCVYWGPDDSALNLWLNPGFLPKVISLNFVNQMIDLLHALWSPSNPQTNCSSAMKERHKGLPYQNKFLLLRVQGKMTIYKIMPYIITLVQIFVCTVYSMYAQ